MLESQLRTLGARLLRLATSAGMGLLHFVLAILIAGVLLAKTDTGRRAADAIGYRLAGARGLRFARLSETVVRSVSRGILGVALIQALLAGLGLHALSPQRVFHRCTAFRDPLRPSTSSHRSGKCPPGPA
ncbi:MAG: hypothetical protein PVH47_05800 [Thiohalocapsa sp.]